MKSYRPALVLILIGLALVLGCLWISSTHAAVAYMRDHIPGGATVFAFMLYGGAGMTFVGAIRGVRAWVTARDPKSLPLG